MNIALGLICAFGSLTASAGEVDVVAVEVRCKNASDAAAGRICTFAVTLRHGDEGWDHYADRWEILESDGDDVLATRVLRHPHVQEQPFTRQLAGVKLGPEVQEVRVRAHDKVHGHGGAEIRVELPAESPT